MTHNVTFYPAPAGEHVGHEYWHRDGIHIGYHGWTPQGCVLGRVRCDDTERSEIAFPGETGHIFSHDASLIVGDGGGVIRLWKREGDTYTKPRLLCRHDSAMRIQQTHPHPRISPDGRYVVFSSHRSGYGNVYRVPLASFDSLPLANP
jgi:oligogalacturonide lyase